ncbi:hypothetical protein KBY83_02425 [Cyanobium sp. WKJ7-Wakatipu]|nr:hypothetical protein [Cyanobium sp. WKJ7-Wakatipu]
MTQTGDLRLEQLGRFIQRGLRIGVRTVSIVELLRNDWTCGISPVRCRWWLRPGSTPRWAWPRSAAEPLALGAFSHSARGLEASAHASQRGTFA